LRPSSFPSPGHLPDNLSAPRTKIHRSHGLHQPRPAGSASRALIHFSKHL
jgi:hypothetical protein